MRRRLLVSYLLVTGLVLLLLIVPLAITYQSRQIDLEEDGLARRGQAVVTAAEDGLELLAEGSTGARDRVIDEVDRVPVGDDEVVAIFDRDDVQLAERGGGALPDPSTLDRLLAEGRARGAFTRVVGDTRVSVVPLHSGSRYTGAVVVSRSNAGVDRRIARYRLALLIGGLAAMGAVVITGVVLARSITAPLDALRSVAARFGGGDLSARADPRAGPPEVRDLAADFNQMADQLGDLMATQTAFVADASHQLRTPLTALRFRLENAAAEADDVGAGSGAAAAESLGEDLEGAVVEVDRMSRLVDGLLTLARADGSAGPPGAVLDLRAEMAGRIEAWSSLAAEHGVDLVGEAGEPVLGRSHPDRFAQILDNLVANALDAVASGGRILVRVETTPAGAELHVVDDGPGMSAEDRVRAFDRFWRRDQPLGDGVRSAGLGGSGLGLAIVARLAAVDGARAHLGAAASGGTDAVVVFRSR